MRKVLKVYKKDIKNILNNPAAVIIILGLMILPSLYAWFNIKSSWDPYSNTSGISVAVVNEDKGYTVKEHNFYIGNEIIKNLKSNNKIGWKFVDRKEAEEGVKRGKYYASILIPKDFSEKIASILSNKFIKPELVYSVNEKRNAIAPKITEKGVTGVQQQVAKSFVEAVNNSIFNVFNIFGKELSDKKPLLKDFMDTIFKINDKIPEINKAISNFENAENNIDNFAIRVKNDIPILKNTVEKASNIALDGKRFLSNSKETFGKITEFLRDDINGINNISNSIDTMVDEGIKLADGDRNVQRQGLVSIKDRFINMKKFIDNINNTLNTIDKKGNMIKIQNFIGSLKEINRKIDEEINLLNIAISKIDKREEVISVLNTIKNNKNMINNGVVKSRTDFETEIYPSIQESFNNIHGIMDDSLKLFESGKGSLDVISSLLDNIYSGKAKGQEEIKKLKSKLPEAEGKINELVNKLKKLDDNKKIDEIIKLLKQDAKKESEFIANPVLIKQNRIYPIKNYGTAMTPFFTTLSLWVGALILVSILSIEVNNFNEELKTYEAYLGRYLTFMTIGLFQALIVTIGDLLILKVEVASPFMFILYGMFISMIFIMIVYTLVSIFGNVGKALAVILLVLQISASGGTFPIEVTPPFFQGLNPFLPFTYAISSMRETVGGILKETMLYNTFILCIYFIISIVLAFLLKSRFEKFNKKFMEKFKKSGLAGEE